MGRIDDLTGKVFGRLTASYRTMNSGKGKWVCHCSCGNEVTVRGPDLKNRHTQSCGCIRIDSVIKPNTIHGLGNHPLYKVWKGIKTRCLNQNDGNYTNYGGRGISVCSEWADDPKEFIRWGIRSGWERGLQIDRRNNDGNYDPNNCHWTDRIRQGRNRRDNVILEFNGEKRVLSEWAEIKNIKIGTLWYRLNNGWSVEDSISTPVREMKWR